MVSGTKVGFTANLFTRKFPEWLLSSIVLANQRCTRTASGERSLDNAFDLI